MLSISCLSLILSYESTEALACLTRILEAWLPCSFCRLTIRYKDWSFSSIVSSTWTYFWRKPGMGVAETRLAFLLLLKLLRLPAILGVLRGFKIGAVINCTWLYSTSLLALLMSIGSGSLEPLSKSRTFGSLLVSTIRNWKNKDD